MKNSYKEKTETLENLDIKKPAAVNNGSVDFLLRILLHAKKLLPVGG
jgi:hypothetical protein